MRVKIIGDSIQIGVVLYKAGYTVPEPYYPEARYRLDFGTFTVYFDKDKDVLYVYNNGTIHLWNRFFPNDEWCSDMELPPFTKLNDTPPFKSSFIALSVYHPQWYIEKGLYLHRYLSHYVLVEGAWYRSELNEGVEKGTPVGLIKKA